MIISRQRKKMNMKTKDEEEKEEKKWTCINFNRIDHHGLNCNSKC